LPQIWKMLVESFDYHIDVLASQDFAVIDGFVSGETAEYLRALIDKRKADDLFRQAGVGRSIQHTKNTEIRGDKINWLKDEPSDPALAEIMERMHNLRLQLNQTCFLGLQDIESHLTVYEPGTGYARHRDAFNNRSHRVITFVLYLNEKWQPESGGQLVLWSSNGEETLIEPVEGRLIFFKSELEHEVLKCMKNRYSLTGWMLKLPSGLTFL